MPTLLLIVFWLACLGPAQAAERGPAAQASQPAADPSQAYRSITLRMSKKDVRRLMGKPNQSTDTLWLYTYADGTTVEVTFSKQRRVTQVAQYKKQP